MIFLSMISVSVISLSMISVSVISVFWSVGAVAETCQWARFSSRSLRSVRTLSAPAGRARGAALAPRCSPSRWDGGSWGPSSLGDSLEGDPDAVGEVGGGEEDGGVAVPGLEGPAPARDRSGGLGAALRSRVWTAGGRSPEGQGGAGVTPSYWNRCLSRVMGRPSPPSSVVILVNLSRPEPQTITGQPPSRLQILP